MVAIPDSLLPWHQVHPILVNFTAALVPVSVASDVFGRFTKSASLRGAAWWSLAYATLATPLTVLAGWFWKGGFDEGILPHNLIQTHQWLGSLLALLLLVLVGWRRQFYQRGESPNAYYFGCASLTVIALIYQGHLGGKMVFG